MFIARLINAPEVYAPLALIVIFSICAHELMHAWTALKQGDDTAARRGHLTLNPLRQMGVMSLIMFAFVGVAWGQVPVDPARMRRRWSHALVAAAGPLTNLGLFVVFTFLTVICLYFPEHFKNEMAGGILLAGATMNLVLFVLNLLPIPGLDGFVILRWFFPRLHFGGSEFAKGAYLVLIVLIFALFSYVYDAAQYLTCRFLELTCRFVDLIFGT